MYVQAVRNHPQHTIEGERVTSLFVSHEVSHASSFLIDRSVQFHHQEIKRTRFLNMSCNQGCISPSANFLKPHQASSWRQSKQINEKAPKFSAFIFIYRMIIYKCLSYFFYHAHFFASSFTRKAYPSATIERTPRLRLIVPLDYDIQKPLGCEWT